MIGPIKCVTGSKSVGRGGNYDNKTDVVATSVVRINRLRIGLESVCRSGL